MITYDNKLIIIKNIFPGMIYEFNDSKVLKFLKLSQISLIIAYKIDEIIKKGYHSNSTNWKHYANDCLAKKKKTPWDPSTPTRNINKIWEIKKQDKEGKQRKILHDIDQKIFKSEK